MVASASVVACLFAPATAGAEDRDGESREAGARIARAVVDFEAGPVYILQNDHRYGASGTDFDVSDTKQRENLVIGRRLSVELGAGRHTAILLYAPLDVTTRATLQRDIQFRETLFPAGTVVDHRYLFDGYRASYLYRLLDSSVTLQVGGSAQIRNAKVAFTALDGSAYDEESDIGIVPALKVRLRYEGCIGSLPAYAMFDADGSSTFGLLGDTEGGLYDVALTFGLPVTERLDVLLRARGLGGGATVPARNLENWAHFFAFTVGFRYELGGARAIDG